MVVGVELKGCCKNEQCQELDEQGREVDELDAQDKVQLNLETSKLDELEKLVYELMNQTNQIK